MDSQQEQILNQEEIHQIDEKNLESVTGGGWFSRLFRRKQYEDPYAELYYHNKEQGLNQNAQSTGK